jgi:hypothetical protein
MRRTSAHGVGHGSPRTKTRSRSRMIEKRVRRSTVMVGLMARLRRVTSEASSTRGTAPSAALGASPPDAPSTRCASSSVRPAAAPPPSPPGEARAAAELQSPTGRRVRSPVGEPTAGEVYSRRRSERPPPSGKAGRGTPHPPMDREPRRTRSAIPSAKRQERTRGVTVLHAGRRSPRPPHV